MKIFEHKGSITIETPEGKLCLTHKEAFELLSWLYDRRDVLYQAQHPLQEVLMAANTTDERKNGMDKLEASILEAVRKGDGHLDDLLREACETMDEERADRLLDRVHQMMSEDLRDLRGWKELPGEEG